MFILTLGDHRLLTLGSSDSAWAPLPQNNCKFFPNFSPFCTLNQCFLITISTIYMKRLAEGVSSGDMRHLKSNSKGRHLGLINT